MLDKNKNIIITCNHNISDCLWDIPLTPPRPPAQEDNAIVQINNTKQNCLNSSMQHFLSPHLQHSSKQLKRFNSPPGKDLHRTSSPSTYHFLQQPQRATKNKNLKIFAPSHILKLIIHSQIPIQNLKNS